MYRIYRNRGQGSITLEDVPLYVFMTYVCGPTLMKLIPHLVSKVRKL